jgi:acetyl-CoA acetyltransferase family protein
MMNDNAICADRCAQARWSHAHEGRHRTRHRLHRLGVDLFGHPRDGLDDAFSGQHSGWHTEDLVNRAQLTRVAQDRFAERSQQRFSAAQKAGKFKDEIVPVMIPQRKGDPIAFATDEFIKAGTTLESVSGLRPAFAKDGSVTAANASGLNDGAAAVIVMSAERAAQLGLKPLAKIKAFASSGVDPAIMGMGPVPASKRALEKAGWKPADLDLMEINEAFAAQAVRGPRPRFRMVPTPRWRAYPTLRQRRYIDPDNALAWRVRGATWAGLANYEKALAEYSDGVIALQAQPMQCSPSGSSPA